MRRFLIVKSGGRGSSTSGLSDLVLDERGQVGAHNQTRNDAQPVQALLLPLLDQPILSAAHVNLFPTSEVCVPLAACRFCGELVESA